MAAKDPERRRAANVENINRRWATSGPDERKAATAAARAARREQLERQVDPDGLLDPAEREIRVRALVRAEMAKLSRLSAASRAAKRTAETDAAIDSLMAAESS